MKSSGLRCRISASACCAEATVLGPNQQLAGVGALQRILVLYCVPALRLEELSVDLAGGRITTPESILDGLQASHARLTSLRVLNITNAKHEPLGGPAAWPAGINPAVSTVSHALVSSAALQTPDTRSKGQRDARMAASCQRSDATLCVPCPVRVPYAVGHLNHAREPGASLVQRLQHAARDCQRVPQPGALGL